MASDLIWSELIRARKKKPVIASMGDVAASGGYYIAAPAERIFCEPFTITGSIGVFGLIPNAENLLTEKMGLTFDEVEVNDHAVQGGLNKPMDALEDKVIRESVAAVYLDFKQHVAEGRKMSIEEVEQVAQGRVWTGPQALDRKLADQLGTLEDAVKYAAKKANVKDYRLRYYPAEKSLKEQIMEGFAEARTARLREELGSMYPIYAELRKISSLKGVQMRLIEQLD
jgi:protease-4